MKPPSIPDQYYEYNIDRKGLCQTPQSVLPHLDLWWPNARHLLGAASSFSLQGKSVKPWRNPRPFSSPFQPATMTNQLSQMEPARILAARIV
jgi:hypothetical protein